jgi:Ca2+-binding RTX toxin-like protein
LDGNDVIFGEGGDDTVNGNRGNDTEILGAGNDTALWAPGEGSDVVDGGAGSDRLNFAGSNAPENVRLTASGSHAVFTRDVAAIRMDLNRVEGFGFQALGSADTITIGDLTGTDVHQVALDLRSSTGADDGAADAISVAGSGRADRIHVTAPDGSVDIAGTPARVGIVGSTPSDTLQIDAGGGSDHVDVADAVSDLIGLTVDLGSGQR